jgi:hypothetical protein
MKRGIEKICFGVETGLTKCTVQEAKSPVKNFRQAALHGWI